MNFFRLCGFLPLATCFLISLAQGQEFSLIVGGTEGDVTWPGNEGPENAINWEGQKYLNFARENTGLYFQPAGPNANDVATSLTIWTANDAVERDPANFQLFGSNSNELLAPLDYSSGDNIPFDLFTEIAVGDLNLPESRNEGGDAFLDDFNSETIEFANTSAYDSYLLLFPNVKDGASANSMQIAEVQLNYDGFDLGSGIFDFDDEVAGVALLETESPVVLEPLVLDDFQMMVGGTLEPHRWPDAEGPENAINWAGQKYLNFTRENTGVFIEPEGPQADVAPTSLTIWSANDAEPRDPASFRILGSNRNDLLSPSDYAHRDLVSLDGFTEIAFGEVQLPETRNDGGDAELDDFNSQTIQFDNSEAFDHYVVLFPTVKDAESANSMQIAELQLNYDGFDLDSGVFEPQDAITGVALVGADVIVDPIDPVGPIEPINVNNFEIVVGSTEDPVRWPDAEGPEFAIDQLGQKYLNFEKEDSGFLLRVEGDNAGEAPTSITIWTANDAEPRDPASFRLFGSNSSELDFPTDYEHEDTIPLDLFTEIAIGDLELPSDRNAGGGEELDDLNSQTIEFENDEVFETYLVVFPTLKESDSANSMQVAEVQLNYDGFDLESGIFEPFDEIIGVALFPLEGVCLPSEGDLDGDGQVGFSDFLILSASFGQEVGSQEEGDIDCNGSVEFADFLILSANFGQSVDPAGQSVPEPNSGCLLLVALTLCQRFRRRESRHR